MEAFKILLKPTENQALDESSWSGVLPTLIFAFLGVLMLVVLSYRPAADLNGVGMVFPFTMSEEQILAQVGAAGGRVTRFGGFGHMAVVVSDDGAQPNAKDYGAMFTLSPLIVSACFDSGEATNAF